MGLFVAKAELNTSALGVTLAIYANSVNNCTTNVHVVSNWMLWHHTQEEQKTIKTNIRIWKCSCQAPCSRWPLEKQTIMFLALDFWVEMNPIHPSSTKIAHVGFKILVHENVCGLQIASKQYRNHSRRLQNLSQQNVCGLQIAVNDAKIIILMQINQPMLELKPAGFDRYNLNAKVQCFDRVAVHQDIHFASTPLQKLLTSYPNIFTRFRCPI